MSQTLVLPFFFIFTGVADDESSQDDALEIEENAAEPAMWALASSRILRVTPSVATGFILFDRRVGAGSGSRGASAKAGAATRLAAAACPSSNDAVKEIRLLQTSAS